MPRQPITGRTTLNEIDALVRLSSSPTATTPDRIANLLAATAIEFGQLASAAQRDFTHFGDRARSEQEIGRAIVTLSLAAQAAGTTLARCLQSYRETDPHPRRQPHAQAAA